MDPKSKAVYTPNDLCKEIFLTECVGRSLKGPDKGWLKQTPEHPLQLIPDLPSQAKPKLCLGEECFLSNYMAKRWDPRVNGLLHCLLMSKETWLLGLGAEAEVPRCCASCELLEIIQRNGFWALIKTPSEACSLLPLGRLSLSLNYRGQPGVQRLIRVYKSDVLS